MKRDLLQNNITPAEGEQSVRSYFCTYYRSKLVGLTSDGYLAITNKRVIFQALGTSRAGDSKLQSEVPIADVSGISSYTGASFSFGDFLGNLFLSLLFGGIVAGILAGIAALGFTNQMNQYYQNSDSTTTNFIIDIVLGWIIALGTLFAMFAVNKRKIWHVVLSGCSSAAFGYLGARSMVNSSFSYFMNGSSSSSASWLLFIPAAALGIYLLIRSIINGWKPTFSLAVGSKGGGYTPISIAGAGGFLNVSAAKALSARPAEDADAMLKEIGAVILDIQTLGDLGITKWKVD
ncbi:MAG: hypothetical protein ACYC59_03220 [Anaerolineaceae bacterium]